MKAGDICTPTVVTVLASFRLGDVTTRQPILMRVDS